jgi:tRNA-dihydrouridine synthase A
MGPSRGLIRPISVAPMMDRTDRHFRVLMRQITKRALLYTEKVTTGAILHGPRSELLAYSHIEHPISLQLGGDDPGALAECARIAEDLGYDEVNLNVGCPSDRVQSGRFGACLMGHPERVAACVESMRSTVRIPVTVKHRIGIDDRDRYEDMLRFVQIVSSAGCDRFSVHARKAWLSGLSPKENRTVPPLRYGEVHRLKREHPELSIEINGGIDSLDRAAEQLAHVDAVMIGRAVYDDPMLFAEVDARFFGEPDRIPTRREVVLRMCEYAEAELARGTRLNRIARHMLNLFANQQGARAWRRMLSTRSVEPHAGVEVLLEALAA